MRLRMARLATALSISLLAACGGGGEDATGESATDQCQHFESSLSSFDSLGERTSSFRQGEFIRLRFSLTNRSDREQALSSGSCTNDTLGVNNRRGDSVWDRDFGLRCGIYIGDRSFRPGETVVFNTTWDQRDNQGTQVPPDTYTAYASIGGACRSSLLRTLGLTIE